MGAAFVSALPLVFQQYTGSLPFIAEPGSPGIVASQAAAFLYGLAVVLVVLFEPAGLAGLVRRFRRPVRAPVRPGAGDRPVPSTPPAQADSSPGGFIS